MDGIGGYVIGIICAAIVCAVINQWSEKKGTHGAILKILTGVFMTITLVSPLLDFDMTGIDSRFSWITADAESAVQNGQILAKDSMAEIIKTQCEAYILDKAAFWELNLSVEVTLSESDPPIPNGVELTGNVSPYAKNQMTNWIVEELGISKEHQVWK
ncbi:MAG: hypothetical protein IKW10_04515 [Oscillospiraceae bacterium]|nr:hypothetical protein [Oscillospiraceae bacterium]